MRDGLVVLLHPGQDPVPGLGDAESCLVELDCVVGLLCLQLLNLLLENLALQFLIVHLEAVLGAGQPVQQILHSILLLVVLGDQLLIFGHEPLVLAPLGGVQLVEP